MDQVIDGARNVVDVARRHNPVRKNLDLDAAFQTIDDGVQ